MHETRWSEVSDGVARGRHVEVQRFRPHDWTTAEWRRHLKAGGTWVPSQVNGVPQSCILRFVNAARFGGREARPGLKGNVRIAAGFEMKATELIPKGAEVLLDDYLIENPRMPHGGAAVGCCIRFRGRDREARDLYRVTGFDIHSREHHLERILSASERARKEADGGSRLRIENLFNDRAPLWEWVTHEGANM